MNGQPISIAKFKLGKVVTTPGALASLSHHDILRGIIRHQSGDWGELDAEDCETNDKAVNQGLRVLSQYRSAQGTKFWIVTEADRSSTCVLLPEEY
jgi:hypothetical protein